MSETRSDYVTRQRFRDFHQFDFHQPEMKTGEGVLEALNDGLQRGIKRCSQNGVGNEEQHQRAVEQTIELLTQSRLPLAKWTSRGVVLFIELLTIGTCIRLVNNQPAITVENVAQYATWTEDIAFCWFCR